MTGTTESDQAMIHRNGRLAANIRAGKSPLTPEMIETIRHNAKASIDIPGPRVVQLIDALDATRAHEAELEAEVERLRIENRQLRYRLDEMDIRAGEVLDSPVVDGRTSVRPEHVAALRATMDRPLDEERMPDA
jgi:regulator of replication initiation timing